MSRDQGFLPPRLAEAATSPPMLATLEQVLATHWDPDGVIGDALAVRPEGPDLTLPRTLAEVAGEVAGILSSGGGEPEVSGYLKREGLRGALWRAVRGISRPGDLPAGA